MTTAAIQNSFVFMAFFTPTNATQPQTAEESIVEFPLDSTIDVARTRRSPVLDSLLQNMKDKGLVLTLGQLVDNHRVVAHVLDDGRIVAVPAK